MLPVQTKAYKILNYAILAASALIALIYFVLLYSRILGPGEYLGTSATTTAIALINMAYILVIFPFLSKKSELAASLIGCSIFTANLIILLLATGGFSSPFYAAWLLLILAVGIYRPSVPIALLVATSIYFAGVAASSDFKPEFFTQTIISLITTYLAGALGFWLWHTQHTKLRAADKVSQLADELTQEQLKSEILLHSIGDGVIVIDNNSRIKLLNPVGEKITGWKEGEAKAIDYNVVMPLSSEDGKPLADEEPFKKSLREKESITRSDVVLQNKEGKKLTLSLVASPIFNENHVVSGGVIVFRDISEAKANERQRDEFISTASHEMRTPVAAIDGYISLALNEKVAQVDDKARKYLVKARDTTHHLGQLFQDLLSTTKLEDGKMPNHPEVFDLSSLAKVAVDELKFKADKKNVSLAIISRHEHGDTRSIQPLYYVNADPERIREVLSNLIDNAIKFSEKGEVTLTMNNDENNVTVGVHDTGIGIASDDLPHLFQKFYRIDNSKTRTIGGTGLGLYLCRTIIELAGGRMWAESKINEGSHFYFSLPRVASSEARVLRAKQHNGAHRIKEKPLVAPNITGKVE